MQCGRSSVAGSVLVTLLLLFTHGMVLAESTVMQGGHGGIASASASLRINVSIPVRVMLNVSPAGVAGQANVADEVIIDASRCADNPRNEACSALGGSGTVYTATAL